MTKKNRKGLEEQIIDMKSKIAARQTVAETKVPKSIGLAKLVESSLQREATILSAQAICDRMQKMATDVAKMEADNLMPLADEMRSHFTPDKVHAFYGASVEAIRGLLDNIQSAKDVIAGQLDALQNGGAANDMANAPDDLGAEPAAPEAEMPDMDDMDDDDMGDDDMEMDAEGGIPEIKPEADIPMGRDRKESYRPSFAKALAESKNPDALVLAVFKRVMKEGMAPRKAARIVAEQFDIDVVDVKEIVKEAASRRSPFARSSIKESHGLTQKEWIAKANTELKKAAGVDFKDDGLVDDTDMVKFYQDSLESGETPKQLADWWIKKHNLDRVSG